MKVAVVNCGSSSLKFKLFDMSTKEVQLSLLIEHIGEEEGEFQSHLDAIESINIDFNDLDVIGHRVVHGGEAFESATIVDEDVLKTIESLSALAPLHNPANLQGIKLLREKAPDTMQVAVFDTSFHSSMPKEAYLYALNYEMYEKNHVRRYGFHGTSHSYVAKQAAKILQKDISSLNLITLHLGNGASICAIKNGKSIDTSMGFTPLEGLVMGTRSGDLDPAIVLYMQKELAMSIDEIDKELNKNSGLYGLCGHNDLREIIASEDEQAQLALSIMIRRIQKYIGSYMVLLEDIDAIVFTGGIGENSEDVRKRVLDNKIFQSLESLVIKTDEELEIAQNCFSVIRSIN